MTDAAAAGVTKIIDRIPRAGSEAELEQAIRNLTAAALKFPGHLGVTVTRPAPPIQPGFRLIYRFDSAEHLRAWDESDVHARLVKTANEFTQGEPQRTVLSGLEAWFTLPSQAISRPPPRHRIAVMTWIGIFPLVYAYSSLASELLPPNTPAVARVAIVTVLVVLTMTYLVGPLLTKVFRRWLNSTRAPAPSTDTSKSGRA